VDRLEHAFEHERSGRFVLALNELEHASIPGDRKTDAQILKAGILERLGRHAQSRAVAMSVLTSRSPTPRSRAPCECILGKIEREKGAIHLAIERFQKAALIADEIGDLESLCWAHLFLMLMVSQRAGPEAATPLLSRARATATKLGQPRMTATLHMFVSQVEAYRGLLDSADTHATLALELIQQSPDLWIEALSLNTRLAVAILTSDDDRALEIGQHALEVAQESGAAGPLRACLGNLGNLSYSIGEFDRAVEYFERALAALPSEGENANAALDTLAKIRLTEDRLSECESLLDRIDATIRDERDWRLYPHRCAAFTRAQFLIRNARCTDALRQIDFVLELTDRPGDPLLAAAAMLVKAQLLARLGHNGEVALILRQLSPTLRRLPVKWYARL
jgi:tetratricopeptide (TPR) repeat protein